MHKDNGPPRKQEEPSPARIRWVIQQSMQAIADEIVKKLPRVEVKTPPKKHRRKPRTPDQSNP